MASMEEPNRIFDPGGMIIARKGVLTEEFEAAIRKLVHEENKMAELSENMKVNVTLEMAQDAEAFIRKLVREEVKKMLDEQVKTRGWQPVKPFTLMEHK